MSRGAETMQLIHSSFVWLLIRVPVSRNSH